MLFKLLGTATMLGLDVKKMVDFFNQLSANYIKNEQSKIDPSKHFVLVSLVVNDDLVIVPANLDENGNISLDTPNTKNISKLVRETDIKKALSIMEENSGKADAPDFFTILQMAKIETPNG